jgi:hypothetical protein
MYQKIAVLGVGGLGGYIVDAITNLDTVKEIVAYDFDKVEEKNLRNSIYRMNDIGRFKTESLREIVSGRNQNINITTYNESFIEGKNKLPKCDLILDCRDYTFDRSGLIDVRLYISSRYLVVDCRKVVQYEKKYQGRYIEALTKSDLKSASQIFLMLIYQNSLEHMIRNQLTNEFDLDYLTKNQKPKQDIIYETHKGEEKLVNLLDNLPTILDVNRVKPIDVFVGSRLFPISKHTIPPSKLTTTQDVVTNLLSFINLPIQFNSYIIQINSNKDGSVDLELIPDTGAA